MGQRGCVKCNDLVGLCVRTSRSVAQLEIEEYGVCSKCGIIYNPFGQKPEWVLVKAEKLQSQDCLTKSEEALL